MDGVPMRPEPPASPPRLSICGLNPFAPDEKLQRVRASLEARLTQPETVQDADLAEWINYYLREVDWCLEQKAARAAMAADRTSSQRS